MSENGSQKVYVPGLFERAKEVTFDVVLGELGLLDQLRGYPETGVGTRVDLLDS